MQNQLGKVLDGIHLHTLTSCQSIKRQRAREKEKRSVFAIMRGVWTHERVLRKEQKQKENVCNEVGEAGVCSVESPWSTSGVLICDSWRILGRALEVVQAKFRDGGEGKVKSTRWAIATYWTLGATPTLDGAIIWHSNICAHKLTERTHAFQ